MLQQRSRHWPQKGHIHIFFMQEHHSVRWSLIRQKDIIVAGLFLNCFYNHNGLNFLQFPYVIKCSPTWTQFKSLFCDNKQNSIHNYVKYMCIRARLQSVKFNLMVRTRKLDLILLFHTARINIGVFEGLAFWP